MNEHILQVQKALCDSFLRVYNNIDFPAINILLCDRSVYFSLYIFHFDLCRRRKKEEA